MRPLIRRPKQDWQALVPAAAWVALIMLASPIARAGHEGMAVDTLPVQHITRVVRLPAREQHAPLYSFFTAYSGFFPDQMRSWRLRVLDGKLAGHTYQISANGPDFITVTDLYGPLDSIAVGDMVMVEAVVERYIPER